MPVFSYVYQLFSVAHCHAYIHTLRWKERPLHCPRCQSPNVGPWGQYHYRPGLKRYWCHGCRRTFNLWGSDSPKLASLSWEMVLSLA
jgi:transposase-like protein